MSCKDTDHSFFVADSVAVEAEGTLTVLAVCTRCGDFISDTVSVSKGHSPLILRSETKNKK